MQRTSSSGKFKKAGAAHRPLSFREGFGKNHRDSGYRRERSVARGRSEFALTRIARIALGLMALVCAVSMAGAQMARAQEAPPHGPRLALLINAPVTRAGGEHVFRPIAALLGKLGFATLTVENADSARLKEAISEFTGRVRKGTTTMVLFRGAMLRVQQTTLLMPADAKGVSEYDAREAGIDLNAFEGELTRKGAAIKIFVVDAARSAAVAERFGLVAGGPAALELHDGTLAIVNAGPQRSGRERAPDVRPGEDDLFLEELQRQTAVPDVTLETAFAKTRLAVAAATGRRQVPSVSSSLSNDFYIARDTHTPSPSPPAPAAKPAPAAPPVPVRGASDKSAEAGGEGRVAPGAASGGPNPGEIFKDCDTCPDLVVVPPGEFSMGSTESEFEKPAHRVVIARAFAIGRHEVTFAQWDACAAANACKTDIDDHGFGRGDRPVIDVSWDEAQAFVKWLSAQTGQAYRLPSEAEWEYAARAGSRGSFAWGAAAGDGRANCADCSPNPAGTSLPVGSFRPNAFGLFDMAGNAAEFVEDCWNGGYRSAPTDGAAWRTGQCQLRVLRGGSFTSKANAIRSAARFRYDRDVRYYSNGFRVARSVP